MTKEGDADDGANGNGAERMRVAYALPDAVEDLKLVAKIGTARYSIPESSRSIEWLEENGVCLDNLRMGKSNIPLAGYGKSIRVKSSQTTTVHKFSRINTFINAVTLNHRLAISWSSIFIYSLNASYCIHLYHIRTEHSTSLPRHQ